MIYDPPEANEIELSVFGPGVGESAAIHVGGGDWVLVDSCVDPRTQRSASIVYLENLGVNLNKNVGWIVATHAHNDHVRGLSQLVDSCAQATLIVPQASSAEEFVALMKIDDERTPYGTRWSSYSEFRDSFAILKARHSDYRLLARGAASKEFPPGASKAGANVSMYFVAPSEVAVTRSVVEFSERIRRFYSPGVSTLPSQDPNTFSSAFVIEAYGVKLLLGGDVEAGSSEWGWVNIANNYAYVNEIDGHKVPHHGSPNAYEPIIWNSWLKSTAVNVVTPYRSSRRPRPDDVSRMRSHGHELWQTSNSESIAASKRAKRAQAALSGLTYSKVEVVGGIMGQVRVRWKEGRSSVQTFGPAFQVV